MVSSTGVTGGMPEATVTHRLQQLVELLSISGKIVGQTAAAPACPSGSSRQGTDAARRAPKPASFVLEEMHVVAGNLGMSRRLSKMVSPAVGISSKPMMRSNS